MLAYTLLAFIFIFFTGAVSGWFIEVLWRRFVSRKKWMNPGLFTGPYLPIYGFGNVFLYALTFTSYIQGGITNIIEVILMFFVSAAFMSFLELSGGYLLLKFAGLRLWDYSDEKHNFKGFICLKYSIIWGLTSLVYYYFINPLVSKMLWYYIQNIYLSYFVGIITGFFLIDGWMVLGVTSRINKFSKEHQLEVQYEEFKEFISNKRNQLEQRRRFFIKPHRELIKTNLEKWINERKTK